jgi:hypothetical protein
MVSLLADNPRGSKNFLLGIIFFLLSCATVVLFFVPAYIIQPFKYESPRGLIIAMALKQYSPWLTTFTAGGALVVAVALWRKLAWRKKTFLVLGMILTCAAAVMARVDYFEWMFHPDTAPGFATIANTSLGDSEMVMAVRFNADARAYPIREMAYHHIVNDVVGGVPIAVTY